MRVSRPCSRYGSASTSDTFAAEARIVWISLVLLSTPTCAFIPKYHCLPFEVVHLRIALAVFVLGGARRADNRRIYYGAVGDLDAITVQVLVHCPQQRLAALVPLEQMSELADRRLVGRTFHPKVDAHK